MLLFLPTFVRDHDPVPAEGWHADGEPYRLYRDLQKAVKAAVAPDGRLGQILVLESDRLSVTGDPPTTDHVAREAVLNVHPDGDLWRPAPIVAAGGVVTRPGTDGPEVLMIFRRGAWDLPKGKQDEGESFRETARREVAEEVGIKKKALALTADLGTTVHGYPWARHDVYAVKTTHWYAMTTTAQAFEPEAREGIEAVAWVPWDEARDRVGFDTLRDLLDRLDPRALVA